MCQLIVEVESAAGQVIEALRLAEEGEPAAAGPLAHDAYLKIRDVLSSNWAQPGGTLVVALGWVKAGERAMSVAAAIDPESPPAPMQGSREELAEALLEDLRTARAAIQALDADEAIDCQLDGTVRHVPISEAVQG